MATTSPEEVAREVAAALAPLPQVAAIAIGGSRSSGAAEPHSDVDLYVYTRAELPPGALQRLIAGRGGSARSDLGLPYWGGVNVWFDAGSGVEIDCMCWDVGWIEGQVGRVMDEHQPSLGYTTAFCRTVAQSLPVSDGAGWFAALQARARQPYPEPLRRNIVAHNHPVLRGLITSYLRQIESALRRGDPVSVNHRLAALLASYFDVVFAASRVLHPGEKRLLAFATRECARLPEGMVEDVGAVLRAAGTEPGALLGHLGRLLDRLDDELRASGFALPAPR